jgi:arabinose operon protein AraL
MSSPSTPPGVTGALGFIVDLDGTVYRGADPIDGVAEALATVRAGGHRVVFATNNSAANVDTYRHKLHRFGIPTADRDVITSNQVLAARLAVDVEGFVWAVGEPPLHEQLTRAGIELTDTWQEAAAVALGWDRQFTYDKLEAICRARAAHVPVYATNPDATCPLPSGDVPDCGALIAAVERATGRPLEMVTGKPSPAMAIAALARLEVPRERCWVIGDRLETDIQMAADAGLRSALVLSGVSDLDDVARLPWQPDLVCSDLPETVGILVDDVTARS